MSNPLTGDFQAVMEVSAATLNRLVATMHQNGFVNATKPSLPHIAYLRLGDHDRVDGVRGSVAAQIGVPRVSLIDGATDRFLLDVGFRARYRADPGSTPLADIIHGTVRAEYRFQEIDPNCWGWQGIAGNYLWMRVVPRSVSFDGVVYNDASALTLIALLNEQQIKAQVTKLLVGLLETQFEPTPQPIGALFRRMQSLVVGAGFGQSGVAIPFGLHGETPAGALGSINELFLGGRDFGLAISRDAIVDAITPEIAPLIGQQRDFHVHGDAGVGGGLEIDYHVRIDGASAAWLGPMPPLFFPTSSGVIRIALSGSGWATRLYRSGVYNIGAVSLSDLGMGFSADQFVTLGFEPATERLVIAPMGVPAVSVNYGGPFAGEVKAFAQAAITAQVQANVAGALSQAQSQLDTLTAPERKSALIGQLRRIDEAANARFDELLARPDGIVLRGSIPLTHRIPPHASFEKTPAAEGFDAIESWIPGGRVDTFRWTWSWFTGPIDAPPGPPGTSAQDDSFLLRRPQGPRSKFGLAMALENPLPGLDGNGSVCLEVRGVRVDHVTGALVSVTSVVDCAQFGYQFRMPYEVGPYLRVCDPLRRIAERPAPEIGIVRVGIPDAPETAFNTLALYLDRTWSDEAASTLVAGLERCRCAGTGLLVLLLFRDGLLTGGDPKLQSQIERLSARLPAPMLVGEDVREGWSTALALPGGANRPAWRLTTPEGVVSWVHDGHIEAQHLASELERRLVPSAPPGLARIRPGVGIGAHVPIELVVRPCPPTPLSRPGTTGLTLVFVQKDRSSSLAQLRRLARDRSRPTDQNPFVAIVLDGASPEEAESLRAELRIDWPIFPDPDGAMTRRAGVPFVPTTLTLDEFGRVTGYELGLTFGAAGNVHFDRAE